MKTAKDYSSHLVQIKNRQFRLMITVMDNRSIVQYIVITVQEGDATMLNSSNADWYIIY
jgi:hypothetical protein